MGQEITTVRGTALSGLLCNCGAKLNRNNKSGFCRECARAPVKAVRVHKCVNGVACKTTGCANEVLPTTLSGLCRSCRSVQSGAVRAARAARGAFCDDTGAASVQTSKDIPAEVLRDGKNRFPRRGFVVAVRGGVFEAFGRQAVPEGFRVLARFTPDGAGGWY